MSLSRTMHTSLGLIFKMLMYTVNCTASLFEVKTLFVPGRLPFVRLKKALTSWILADLSLSFKRFAAAVENWKLNKQTPRIFHVCHFSSYLDPPSSPPSFLTHHQTSLRFRLEVGLLVAWPKAPLLAAEIFSGGTLVPPNTILRPLVWSVKYIYT